MPALDRLGLCDPVRDAYDLWVSGERQLCALSVIPWVLAVAR